MEQASHSRAEAPRFDVVSMPFASTRRPSLQLGLLKALAAKEGWVAECHHLSLDFAAMIGRASYEILCQHRGMQLAEWIFAAAAFQDELPEDSDTLLDELPPEYMGALAEHLDGQPVRDWLLRLRDVVAPAFTRAAAMALVARRPHVVGFTSTFQQNVASFALARAVKALDPGIATLFGGANFDDVMRLEYVRSINAIDYAAIGEGDESLPAFLRAVAWEGDPGAVAGIASRNGDGTIRYTSQPGPFTALDSLPIPEFDDYFTRAERLGLLSEAELREVDLPVEGSRGCWWGAKHHCVFCGLNAGTMQFRAKSPQRFLDEIAALSRRHRSFHIEAVDNIIDMGLFKQVLDDIAQAGYSWNIFFEVKSNLRREQVEKLAAAGVRRIQPGIESLSTEVLRLMRKGVSCLQNVNLLRWCARYGIRPSWNLLWGFPGERADYYHAQVEMIPALHHLAPPDGQGRLWMERFSPLFFDSKRLGVLGMAPNRSYGQVYPRRVDLEQAAYFFDYDLDGALPEDSFLPLVAALDGWRAAAHEAAPPRLTAHRAPGYLCIEDTREFGHRGRYDLEGELAEIYDFFFEAPAGIALAAQSLGMDRDRIEDAVGGFVERGLMLRENDLALALAIPTGGGP